MSRKENDFFTALRDVAATDDDKKEEKRLSAIVEQRAVDDHGRDRITRNVISLCVRSLVVLVFLVVAATIFALSYHYLAPAAWFWLSEDQIADVKNFALSGAVVSMATAFIKKYV